MTFKELNLSAPLLRAVQEAGYETPSPIQAAAIPPVLAGRDLMGCAQTGTGKTAAFALPMLDRLTANAPRRKNILIAFPNTVELVFLPSGEVVAPTALTAVGARSASNDIQAISALDATTTAKLHLYSVAADGTRTEEFDGTKLLVPRRIGIQEDFPYQMELEGFDRARDADIIAAAIESPQHLMTLRFDFSPVLS